MQDLRTRIGWCATVLLALLAPLHSASAQAPTSLINTMGQVTHGTANLGDLDNDGDLDFVMSGVGQNGVVAAFYRFDRYILVNRPNRPPEPGVETGLVQPLPFGGAFAASTLCDVNRDGLLDLYASGSATAAAPYQPQGVLLVNTGLEGRRFDVVQAGLAPTYGGSAACADYDHDGDPDLLVTGVDAAGAYVTRLYRNDPGPGAGAGATPGAVRFVDVDAGLPGVAYGEGSWVDFDVDGDPDVFLTGVSAERRLSVLYRNDGGTFAPTGAVFPGLGHADADWGDYDDDGDPDLLLAGSLLSPDLARGLTRLFRNDTVPGGAAVFTDVPAALPPVFSHGIAWGDYDGDGHLDVLLSGLPTMLTLDKTGAFFRGDGRGAFARVQGVVYSGMALGELAVGDVDRDRDLDVFTVGSALRPQTVPYRNEANPSNQPPSAPVALRAAAEAGGPVVLAWDAAADAETPAPGLTYNVRVGTAPGLGDVVAPMADAATGQRRLSAPGNAGQGRRLILEGLAPGTYYWSVQALDHTYTGSAFAPEASFTAGPTGTE